MRHDGAGGLRLEPGQGVVHEIDARGEDEPVVAEHRTVVQANLACVRIDRGHAGSDELHSVAARESVPRSGQVADAHHAADDPVTHGARNEARVRL
ncbi:hypothetical protein RZS08_07370, partial [Arthrospira platensis SPKY1]|nr:hypothetical protein [Arthrospira platensis SPKY1]